MYDDVYIQRDDLCYPCTKIRGVRRHLRKLEANHIGVLDSRDGRNGLSVTIACNELGKRTTVFWPKRKTDLHPTHYTAEAEQLGAQLEALPAGRQFILQNIAKRSFTGHMLPNALKLAECVEAVAEVVSTWDRMGSVVVPTGTGTLAAGVVRGLRYPTAVYLVSTGKVPKLPYIAKMSGRGLENVHWVHWTRSRVTPWPSDPRYEQVAWSWVQRQLDEQVPMPKPIMFWSAG